jgi:chromosome segregation ATPase
MIAEVAPMKRLPFLLLTLLLVSTTAFAQAIPTDSATLKALLAEVRLLRHDLQTNTAPVQRAQILFYRMQTQEIAVARALQRLDDARSNLAETQSTLKNLTAEAKGSEDSLSHTENPMERENLEDMLHYFKRKLETLTDEEQQRQAKQIEAEERMRIEQGKLSELQERLDELDRTLGQIHATQQ